MSGPDQPGLRASDLRYARNGREVLRDVSIDLPPGTFTGLLGPNGSGKTTLLRLLLGLIEPLEGAVFLDGAPLAGIARRTIASRIAYVPQSHHAAFPFRVADVVAMGRTPAGRLGAKPSAADREAVAWALQRMGLSDFAGRSYAELSGGERQSVLIARALAQGARTLVLDEPSASLDLGQQVRVMQLLRGLAEEGHAVLMSVHQPELVLRWCDRAALLDRAGRALQGPTRSVVTADRLSQLYGVPITLVQAEGRDFLLT